MQIILIIVACVAVVALFIFQRSSYRSQLRMQKESYERQLEAERKLAGDRFKAMASDVLLTNSRQLNESSLNAFRHAISPFKESLDEFRRGYRECYDRENNERISLREEIRTLRDLNTRVEAETARLSSALKGNNSVQGRWGEMILVNILEHSGLQQGRWFVTQESTTTTDGTRLRPDAIIHCPHNREIIIDSKVNLTHYLQALEATDADTRDAHLKEHARAVERQMVSLSRKEYQANIGAKKGDFVVMFMPHEGAYMAAMNALPGLWEQAYTAKVVIASPTHLTTIVRLVEQMWHSEDTTENAMKIAETASTMLDSVSALLADFDRLGGIIDKAAQQHETVAKRLVSGNNNITRVAERLRELGVKGKKS